MQNLKVLHPENFVVGNYFVDLNGIQVLLTHFSKIRKYWQCRITFHQLCCLWLSADIGFSTAPSHLHKYKLKYCTSGRWCSGKSFHCTVLTLFLYYHHFLYYHQQSNMFLYLLSSHYYDLYKKIIASKQYQDLYTCLLLSFIYLFYTRVDSTG